MCAMPSGAGSEVLRSPRLLPGTRPLRLPWACAQAPGKEGARRRKAVALSVALLPVTPGLGLPPPLPWGDLEGCPQDQLLGCFGCSVQGYPQHEKVVTACGSA